MRIVVADGRQEADYIINLFNTKKNQLHVINSDVEICKELSKKNHLNVIYGKINKEFDLHCAQIEDADLFVALSNDDIKNYVACQMAKMIFRVKKVVASCHNPKNVEIFKRLGIDNAISSTYLLGETIKCELSMEEMIRTLSFENNKIIVQEIEISSDFAICSKALKEVKFPNNTSVCCLYRSTGMVIPNGETVISKGDKVLIVSNFNDQKIVKDFITKRK